jgi:hypothetical protein
MSEPFVISDTERPNMTVKSKYTISLSSESSAYQGQQNQTVCSSFKSIGGLSPGRVEQYMQQFSYNPTAGNNTTFSSSNRPQGSSSNYRQKFKKGKRKFQKERIQTLNLNNSTRSGIQNNENQPRNYYNDDPGFTASDFSLQWEGMRASLD